jgi:hypothetical protein
MHRFRRVISLLCAASLFGVGWIVYQRLASGPVDVGAPTLIPIFIMILGGIWFLPSSSASGIEATTNRSLTIPSLF